MGGYYIGVNVKADSSDRVRDSLVAAFAAEGFTLIQDIPASEAVDDDDNLPAGDAAWYGVLLGSHTEHDWVSVYVDDWQDSGLIARRVSESLHTQALEIWVADDVNWGYNYWQSGQVADRFADNPAVMTSDPTEAELYRGTPSVLGPILEITDTAFEQVLNEARDRAGQFAGPSVDGLCESVGLPFEHAFTAYEYFFADDPGDYAADMDHWQDFRHLAFRHPENRERLSE